LTLHAISSKKIFNSSKKGFAFMPIEKMLLEPLGDNKVLYKMKEEKLPDRQVNSAIGHIAII